MRRRRFLLALGAGVSLAGCSSRDRDPSPPPTDEPPETTTTTTGPPSGEEFYQYLLSASDLGEGWERSFQSATPRYAQRGLEHTTTGRRLGVSLQVSETVADAETYLEDLLSRLEGGEELDADIGDETYESYPAEFDTGVLFRDGVNTAFVALAPGDETTSGTTTPDGTTNGTTTQTAGTTSGTTASDGTTNGTTTQTAGTTSGTTASDGTDAGVTVEDAIEYAEQLHEKLPASS